MPYHKLWYSTGGMGDSHLGGDQKKCRIGDPLAKNNGDEVFCGSGPTTEECPDTHICHSDQLDGSAYCCEKGTNLTSQLELLTLVSNEDN